MMKIMEKKVCVELLTCKSDSLCLSPLKIPPPAPTDHQSYDHSFAWFVLGGNQNGAFSPSTTQMMKIMEKKVCVELLTCKSDSLCLSPLKIPPPAPTDHQSYDHSFAWFVLGGNQNGAFSPSTTQMMKIMEKKVCVELLYNHTEPRKRSLIPLIGIH